MGCIQCNLDTYWENFFEFSVFEGVPTDIVAHFGGKIKEGFAGDAGGGAPPFFENPIAMQ